MRGMITRGVLLATGVLAAVSVAACSGSLTATGTATAQGTGTQTSAAAPTTVDTTIVAAPTGHPAPANPAGPAAPVATKSPLTPECKAANLKLSFGGGDAGMSHEEQVLRFTNAGAAPCVMVGFPGVSYVAGDQGTQVGAPAQRDGQIGAQITLRPGQVASTVITSVEVEVFDSSACRPTAVRGYRVYAPDDTAAMFIALPNGVEGCAGTSPSPQLTVASVKAGPGDPDRS